MKSRGGHSLLLNVKEVSTNPFIFFSLMLVVRSSFLNCLASNQEESSLLSASWNLFLSQTFNSQ